MNYAYKSLGIAIILGLILSISPTIAADGEAILDPLADRSLYYKTGEGRPLADLLNAGELARYHQSLESGDCDPAYALVTNAYANAFPDEPHPGTDIYSSTDWRINVAHDHYPELVYCHAMRNLNEARAHTSNNGTAYERFMGIPRILDDTAQLKSYAALDMAIFELVSLARDRYPLSYLALATLSDEGKIIRFTREFQYYLVLRIKLLGFESPELDKLTARAAARLGPELRRKLRRQAENAEFEIPGSTYE